MKIFNEKVNLNDRTIQYSLLSQGSEHLAIVLPGAGYTAQAPLLYYSTSLFVESGYDVLHVNYSYSQKELKTIGAERFSQDVNWVIEEVSVSYSNFTFCAKSLGTLALTHIIDSYESELCIWLTPLLQREDVYQQLLKTESKGLVVIGYQDPCYIKERFNAIKENTNLNFSLVKGANHSLEVNKQHPKQSIVILNDYLNQLENMLS